MTEKQKVEFKHLAANSKVLFGVTAFKAMMKEDPGVWEEFTSKRSQVGQLFDDIIIKRGTYGPMPIRIDVNLRNGFELGYPRTFLPINTEKLADVFLKEGLVTENQIKKLRIKAELAKEMRINNAANILMARDGILELKRTTVLCNWGKSTPVDKTYVLRVVKLLSEIGYMTEKEANVLKMRARFPSMQTFSHLEDAMRGFADEYFIVLEEHLPHLETVLKSRLSRVKEIFEEKKFLNEWFERLEKDAYVIQDQASGGKQAQLFIRTQGDVLKPKECSLSFRMK